MKYSRPALLGGSKSIKTKLNKFNTIGFEEEKAVKDVIKTGVLSKYLGCWDNDFFGGPKVKLLIRSKAVGIVTGTMGLEAIANEVPVLCFGNVYYKFFNGIFAIETIDDLSSAINKIKRGYKVNSADLIDSFKKIPKNYFQGYSNYEFEKVSNISHKKNVINLVNNLFGFLQETKLIR